MKYELKRDFYYAVYKSSQPRFYNTKVDMFDDLISLRILYTTHTEPDIP